jgi:hypothetical protein
LLTTVAVIGASVFAVAVALLTLVFWSDALARGIGERVRARAEPAPPGVPSRPVVQDGRAARAVPSRRPST